MAQKMNPLVSIIVPCYNQEDYINDALESVYNQTYTNWECIVMDDGSEDRSEEIIQQWISKDTRFKYYYKDNGGICETRNFAIQCATGEYILPLDGDDKLHDTYIEKAIDIFLKRPETKLVYCDTIMFGAKNEIIKSPPYNFQKLLIDNTIPCTGVFRRVDFEKTKGYNLNMNYGLEDWDFWVSFLNEEDKVVKLDDNLVYYRIKDISRSTLIKEQEEKNEAMLLQIFKNNQEKYLQHFNPIRNKILADHYQERTDFILKTSEYTIGKTICYPFRILGKIWRKLVG